MAKFLVLCAKHGRLWFRLFPNFRLVLFLGVCPDPCFVGCGNFVMADGQLLGETGPSSCQSPTAICFLWVRVSEEQVRQQIMFEDDVFKLAFVGSPTDEDGLASH